MLAIGAVSGLGFEDHARVLGIAKGAQIEVSEIELPSLWCVGRVVPTNERITRTTYCF